MSWNCFVLYHQLIYCELWIYQPALVQCFITANLVPRTCRCNFIISTVCCRGSTGITTSLDDVRVVFWDNRIQVWCDVLKRTDCKSLEWVDTEMAVLLVYWSDLCLIAAGRAVLPSERGQNLTCPHRTEVSPASMAPPNPISSTLTCIWFTGWSPNVSWLQTAFW